MKILTAILLGTLFAFVERLRRPAKSVALANSLGLINEHGIESLLLDPASTNAPFGNRFLLVCRGASGYQYGDLCGAASMPLGPTPDAPYATGDVIAVRRLGSRPGLELGIASAAIAIDTLICVAAGGKVQQLSTAANGTYWVVGRSASAVTAASDTMEVSYVPMDPYQLTVTNGTLTYPVNPT